MENSVGTVFYMKSSLIYINKEKNAETKKKAVDSVFLPRKKVGFYKKIEFHHIKTLENVFLERPYPSREEIKKLAIMINETEKKVQDWFKSQRKKDFYSDQKVIKTYKTKRTFDNNEKKILEKAFREKKTLNLAKLKELQELLKCTENQVKQWFYYRQRKLRSAFQTTIAKLPEIAQKNDSPTQIFLEENKAFSKDVSSTQHSVSALSLHELPNENALKTIEENASLFNSSKRNESTAAVQTSANNKKFLISTNSNDFNINAPLFANTMQMFPNTNNIGITPNPHFFHMNSFPITQNPLFLQANNAPAGLSVVLNDGMRQNSSDFIENKINFNNCGFWNSMMQSRSLLEQQKNNNNCVFMIPLPIVLRKSPL